MKLNKKHIVSCLSTVAIVFGGATIQVPSAKEAHASLVYEKNCSGVITSMTEVEYNELGTHNFPALKDGCTARSKYVYDTPSGFLEVGQYAKQGGKYLYVFSSPGSTTPNAKILDTPPTESIIQSLISLAVPKAEAAIAISTTYSGNAGPSSTTSETCPTGGILFLSGNRASVGETVTVATFNGANLTFVDEQAGGGRTTYMYFDTSQCDGAAHNVVITLSIAGGSWSSDTYSGVNASGQPDATAKGTDVANNITVTLTTVKDNDWTMMGCISSNGTYSAGAGTFLRVSGENSNSVIFDSNAAITPAGSTSLVGNNSGSFTNACVMVAFAPTQAATRANSGIDQYKMFGD